MFYIVAVVCQFTVPAEIRPIISLAIPVVGLAGAVFVFLLAIKIFGTGVGVLLGILSMIPCLGLLVLLTVNGRATEVLKQNGVKVGLLGAKISEI